MLSVLEPMRNDWGSRTPGEFQAPDYLAAQRAAAGYGLDHNATLAAAMGPSAWVVGCESYALVAALAAGRQVCSSLPPWAPACRLPHTCIRHLSRSSLALRSTAAGDRSGCATPPGRLAARAAVAVECGP